jgi:hypothetical protein
MSTTIILSAIVLALGRAVDLLGTWAASPDLKLETNVWMRRLGWPRTLLINVLFVLVLILVADRHAWILLGVFSALLGLRNAQLAWIARALGPDEYREKLRLWMRSARLRVILGPLLLEMTGFAILGLAVSDGSVLREHPQLWYVADIGRGIVMFGLFVGLLRGLEVFHQRRVGG